MFCSYIPIPGMALSSNFMSPSHGMRPPSLLPIPDPQRTEPSALPSTTGRLFSTPSFDQYLGIDQYLRLIS
jgi:hypothetical protein